jgi:hypothetical protein
MSTAPTDLDYIAAIIALIILVVSVLTLFGMGIMMAAGAVFSRRPLVTSWPTEQEHSFESFERRSAISGSQAWAVSIVGAVALAIFAIGVYAGVAPDKRDITKDMNMSNLTKRRPSATKSETPAEKPDTPKAEAPKAQTPAPPAPKQ